MRKVFIALGCLSLLAACGQSSSPAATEAPAGIVADAPAEPDAIVADAPAEDEAPADSMASQPAPTPSYSPPED